MNAIRIRRKLESDTPHLPELKPLVGKNVEIIVLDDSLVTADVRNSAGPENRLQGSVLRYDNPFEPAVLPEEWEANP